MTRYILFVLFITLFSCGNERIVQLPEVEQSDIHEVLDVSPIYIFYDETQPDSTLFNRKNMISTTNWLVNVDKRLTLRQVVPHLQYLQDKRQKGSMHKNEAARNYFTCNDKSISNLGFLDFTDAKFHLIKDVETAYDSTAKKIPSAVVHLSKHKDVTVFSIYGNQKQKIGSFAYEDFFNKEQSIWKIENFSRYLLILDKSLSFQDYITFKSRIHKNMPKHASIYKREFIY